MKINLDLIRAILLHIESHPIGFIDDTIALDDYSNDEVGYHLVLMIDRGLIEGEICQFCEQQTPNVIVKRMTWAGHDFLNACRDEGRWVESKEIFVKLGGVTFDVAKEILVSLMTTAAKQIITGGAF